MKNKYSFKNDYSEGVHENILKAMIVNNSVQENGYSEDNFTSKAKEEIYKKIGKNNSDIHLVSGGTQANLIVISSILRPYESIIASSIGHISVHETGAIEATGHKINTVKLIMVN